MEEKDKSPIRLAYERRNRDLDPQLRKDLIFLSGCETVLAGFSPDYGVFVVWEARYHHQYAYSRNVQVREHLLEQARRTGWAVDEPRRVANGQEVRGAVSPGNLTRFIRLAREADLRGLTAERKEAFLLSFGRDISTNSELPAYLGSLRGLELVTRAARDTTFSPRVKWPSTICVGYVTLNWISLRLFIRPALAVSGVRSCGRFSSAFELV